MNSDQLVLELLDERLNVPWAGVAPRALTRVGLSLIFKAQAAKERSIFVDPIQCDLFENTKWGPQIYLGAPSLLPLPRRHNVKR